MITSQYFDRVARIRTLASSVELNHQKCVHALPGPEGEELSIDFFSLNEAAENVILHISGVHGAEGFLGSLVQERILENFPKISPNQGLCFIHAVNPYGMAFNRRTNADNIDLNRNGIDFSKLPDSDDYHEIAFALEPQSWMSRLQFLPKLGVLLSKWGKDRFASAVAAGQYEYPNGIFFGGREQSWELASVEKILRSTFKNIRVLSALDVHSGLGPYNHEFLIADRTTKLSHIEELRKIYQATIHVPSAETGYAVHGAMGEFLSRILPEVEIRHITQEFGTFDTLSNLACLIEENSNWNLNKSKHNDHSNILSKVFFPEDPKWRKDCVDRGEKRFMQLLESNS